VQRLVWISKFCRHYLSKAASYGQYTYRNNPNVYFASDNIGIFSNGLPYTEFGKAYIKNYRQGGTPQTALSAGLRYSSPKYWGRSQLEFPRQQLLRSVSIDQIGIFVQNGNSGTPYYNIDEDRLREILRQNKLPSAHFFNVMLKIMDFASTILDFS
jgi:hypothetical protein